MPEPLVSCVIPVFNGESYLDAALDSVYRQTLQVDDIIVVDDGSTDATRTVAARHADRIRYIAQARAGVGAARNHGIEASRGECIGFLDADDLWHPAKVERQVAHMRSHPEIGVLFTYAQNFWVDKLRSEEERFRDHRIAKPQPAYIASTMMVRRSIFREVGSFRKERKHGETLDWVLRVQRAGVVVQVLPEVLTRRRLHATNTSRMQRKEMVSDFLDLLKTDLDHRRGKPRPAEPSA